MMSANTAFATAYQVPPINESLVGEIKYVPANSGDNVFLMSLKVMTLALMRWKNANPYLDMRQGFKPGMGIVIPIGIYYLTKRARNCCQSTRNAHVLLST